MKRPVRWAREALDDVKDQVAFIAQDNPHAARRIAQALRHAGDTLSTFATGRPGRVAGTFEKVVGSLPFVICYVLREGPDGESVVIIRVIHTSRDWPPESWPE
ncbi:type II toxin-antitoxin system RelE/ParE family toxin [Segnochrobactrum spirostomi]|uniref:Type II toxin-antitoxin system RelE/ParE family toxin n=1 Tax=Segnochrobactrum spirostomi TaxID=2608987 RepID=A0A6A7Y6M8_9HYPH|nr:type II toxin-antitoxin system RelE/ParE family toxin [Segnochrobactrum spirostomi]MQT13209.1 type II toxin-antitoxin system RelE/ParE family toxin [Segnochrobactrum spirostomi]